MNFRMFKAWIQSMSIYTKTFEEKNYNILKAYVH